MTPVLNQKTTNEWPVTGAGLNRRVERCAQAAGLVTIGQLRARTAAGQPRLPRLGRAGRRNLEWFFDWTRRIEQGESLPANLRAWMTDFFTTAELFVIEQRFGLTDPLFRPGMRQTTLREIAEARGGQTRERIRQLLQRAKKKLRSRLAQATAQTFLRDGIARIEAAGGVVTSAELASWRGTAWLGGYQPWGALLLLSEVTGVITRRHDYFSTLPAVELERIEQTLLQALQKNGRPVRAEAIAGTIPVRVAGVVLDRHPGVDATRDGRFFLFPEGARALWSEVSGNATAYNELVAPHSRREPSELARLL